MTEFIQNQMYMTMTGLACPELFIPSVEKRGQTFVVIDRKKVIHQRNLLNTVVGFQVSGLDL